MKPRIRRAGPIEGFRIVVGFWECRGNGVVGFGDTPRQAWSDWRISNIRMNHALGMLRLKAEVCRAVGKDVPC